MESSNNQLSPLTLSDLPNKNDNKCLFSIITVVYNSASTLRRAIQSVLAQQFNSFEYVIIDGGSTDGSLEIIKEYSDQIAYWISEPDNGIYNAWNKAIKQTRGQYISFLGADDEYLPGALLIYCNEIEKANGCDYISSRAILGSGSGQIFGKPLTWPEFGRYMTVAHVGSFHNSLLYREQNYDEAYVSAGDYEFLLRQGPGINAKYFDTITVLMGANGVSNKRIILTLSETLKAKISHRSSTLLLCYLDFLWALFKSYLRAWSSILWAH